MIDATAVPTVAVEWRAARRIIRSAYPPIDLFEDIADPADWPLLLAAEQKTNPRLMETIGNLDLVPPERRVGGDGASYLMAPFTHVSPDRPTRFATGAFGVLYIAGDFATALAETIHHHERFLRRTREPAGWTSQFRELVLDARLAARDLTDAVACAAALDPDDYREAQRIGAALRAAGDFATALAETIHHHERFLRRTREPAGWTSQFRELVLDARLAARDLSDAAAYAAALDPDDYREAQRIGAALRAAGADGVLYPSVRNPGGQCLGLFYPDCAGPPVQGRHLDYHWNGARVDYYREPATGAVFAVR